MSLISINPYTGTKIEEFEEYSDSTLQQLLTGSLVAFDNWKKY